MAVSTRTKSVSINNLYELDADASTLATLASLRQTTSLPRSAALRARRLGTPFGAGYFRTAPKIILLALIALSGAAHAGTPVVDVTILLEKIPGGLIVDPKGGDGIDEVCVSLPKKATPAGIREVTRADAGWRLDTSTKGQVCARREDALGPQPVIFEFAEAPKPGKFDVTVRGGGEVLFRRKGIASRDLAPVEPITDPSEVLDFPSAVTRGELVLARVTKPDAVPAGGNWSFSGGISGVVLEPEEDQPASSLISGTSTGLFETKEEKEDQPASSLISGTSTGAYEVKGDKEAEADKEVKQGAASGAGGSAGSGDFGGSGSLTGFVLEPEDLEAIEKAIEGEPTLVLFVHDSFGVTESHTAKHDLAMATIRNAGEAEARTEEDDDQTFGIGDKGKGEAGGPKTLGGGDPLKGLNVSKSNPHPNPPTPPCTRAKTAVPPGHTIKGDAKNPKPLGNTIQVPFDCPELAPGNESEDEATGGSGDGEVTLVPVRVTYINQYGQVLVDGEIEVTALPSGGEGIEPAIVFGTKMAFAGQQACVCGSFPKPRHWNALSLDGEPLRPLSATSTMVSFALPGGAAPGSHRIDGNPELGFTEEDRWDVTALQLQGSIDQNELFGGGSTTMHLNVLGTAEELDVRLRNTTPSVVSLEGGDEQVATTSGAEPNTIDRTVQAKSRGAFNIEWSLGADPCPCTGYHGRHQRHPQQPEEPEEHKG